MFDYFYSRPSVTIDLNNKRVPGEIKISSPCSNMSLVQLCILNWILDEYPKYDVKKRGTKTEPLITHSRPNIEGLSTIWDTCDLMSGTGVKQGTWQGMITVFARIRPSQTRAEYRLSVTDWDAFTEGSWKKHIFMCTEWKLRGQRVASLLFSSPPWESVRVWAG